MPRPLLQCTHLSLSFGPKTIFEDIAFSIHSGEHFAIIGENGAGKTTLLRLMSGLLMPDSGKITTTPLLSLELLPQEISLPNPFITVREYVEDNLFVGLEAKMASCLDTDRLSEWATLHETYEQLGGYRKMPIEQVCKGLKLEPQLLDLPISALSSGQRVRTALAKTLLRNPDLLLLDEPTNHLDQDMLGWLVQTLSKREGACVIVSHDRKFLNSTCNRLIEIKNGKLSSYGGGYDFYLQEQERVLERQLKAYEVQEEERVSLQQSIKSITFSKKAPTPCKDRNIMAYDRRGEKHQKSLQHKLDIMKARLMEINASLLPHPKPKSITGLRFLPTPLESPVAIELDNITISHGDKTLFSGISRSILRGDRIVVVGPNGCGKTTLLKALFGLTGIRRAPSAKIAFLDQEVSLLPMEQTPLQYFKHRFNLSEEEVRRELHKAALGGGEVLQQPFGKLSTGQRKRLMLLTLVLERPNILLLDEPTNHLDFLTLEAFEKALLELDGTIIAASHDATFIEKIATSVWHIGNL